MDSSLLYAADSQNPAVTNLMDRQIAPRELDKLHLERDQLAAQLASCMELNRTIFAVVPVGLLLYAQDGQCMMASEAAAQILGETKPQLLEQNFHQIKAWKDFGLPELMERVLLTGQAERQEIRYQRSFEKELWLDVHATPVKVHATSYLLLLINDVTGQKHARQQLALQQAQQEDQLVTLSSAIEQSPVSVVITDTTGAIEYVNPQFTRLTGYSLSEVKGQNPRLLKSGETPKETYEALWQTITSGGQWHGEFHNRAKDGTLFWESVKISPIVNTQGETTHYLAIKEDISARMKREQEQNALLTLAMALRAANSRDEIVASILEQGARMVGAPIAAFISCNEGDDELTFEAAYRDGDPIYEALLPVPKGAGISAMTLKSGKPYRCDNVFEDEGFLMTDLIGDERSAVCLPLIANGEALGVLWVMRSTRFTSDEVRVLSAAADMGAISLQRARLHDKVMRYTINLENEVASRTKELAEANERLKELDRLKSKFVSDVTHELRTPVTNIGLYLTLLEHKPQKLAEYIPILTGQAERLRTLVKDTLDLSRMDHNRERLNIAAVDLNELVTNVVAAHSVRAEELQLALEFISDSTLPLIKGDSDRLTQVVTNLVANALNYTPNGQVRITTSFDSAECMVCCSVEDTGCGIHMDDIPRLFDRFYRGRRDEMAPVPGTGLGLSIVKEIVDMHGGKIDVTSEIGFGSTFTVSLPLSQKPSVPGRESAGREKA